MASRVVGEGENDIVHEANALTVAHGDHVEEPGSRWRGVRVSDSYVYDD